MSDNDIVSCFSSTYSESRAKFLSACKERSLAVESRRNPNAVGAQGEDLFMDIARIGPEDAAKSLLLMSGTHGVEGYCGSGAQVALLRNGYFEDLPSDVSIVLLHALNPYGFSHDRRVNEDNIDLNRNFLDFDQPERPAGDYAAIHEYVLPSDWGGPAMEAANAKLFEYIAEHGMTAFQAAISSGQYRFPDGIFYGGDGPSWSNTTLRSVVSDYVGNANVLGVIDFHTGLGPYGYGELIADGSAAQKALASAWYHQEVTDPDAGTSTSAPLDGVNARGIIETVPDAQVAFIAAEFGTRDINTVLTALRADNWLYQKGDLESDLGKAIKRDIRDAFYPDEDDWKHSVWSRSEQIVDWALAGLRDTQN